jgi:hypothetical protein
VSEATPREWEVKPGIRAGRPRRQASPDRPPVRASAPGPAVDLRPPVGQHMRRATLLRPQGLQAGHLSRPSGLRAEESARIRQDSTVLAYRRLAPMSSR